MKTKPCRHCQGTGRVPDPAKIGKDIRRRRERLGISLRAMAAKASCSPAYLSNGEHGHRNWTGPALRRILKLLDQAEAARQRRAEP